MKPKWTVVVWLVVAVYSVSVRSARRKQPDVNRESGIIDIDDDTQESFLDPVEVRSEPASRNAGRNRASLVTQTRRKLTTVPPLRVTEREELLIGSGDGSNDNDELDIDASGDEISGGGQEQVSPAPIVCQNVTFSGRKNRVFVPQCTADGKFAPMQCDNRVGQCWCVNPLDGREVAGTRQASSSKPSCSLLDVPANPVTTSTTLSTSTMSVASSTKLPTTKMTFSYVSSSSTSRPSVASRQPSTHKQTTVARPSATYTRSTVASTTTSPMSSTLVWEPNNKINQFPSGSDRDDSGEQPDWTKNQVDTAYSGPKSHRLNLRSTIIGQPGILAGIIGAAVVILLCLVLLIMFIIYRMHRKSQDPGIYYIDARKPMTSKKAGYMKALDHDVYT